MAAKIGILLANGFDEDELGGMRQMIAEAGLECEVIAAKKHEVRGWHTGKWGQPLPVSVALVDVQAKDYAALAVPGGVLAADTLRSDHFAVDLVRGVLGQGRAVAVLGHAPWLLIEAGVAKGHLLSSAPAIRSDIENAGARWVDDGIADGPLISGRHRHDLPFVMGGLLKSVLNQALS
ncbi:MAG: DJ-1/PfpI family protein [Rhodospirillales bacterium]|nr:DJ-1/PfpI family protein [Rhodospirillales bacterium]